MSQASSLGWPTTQEGHTSHSCRPGGSETFHSSPTALSVGGPACLPGEAQVTCLLPLLGPRSLPQEATWVLLGGGQVRGELTHYFHDGQRRLGPWDLTT